MSQEETVLLLGVVICVVRFMWGIGGGAEGFLDFIAGWDDAEFRRASRMARNRAFIERCEKLTGKKFETYGDAVDAWDDAGYFLPWRRWRASRSR